jgi:hypothetical protein
MKYIYFDQIEILHRKVNDLGLSIDFKAKTSWD